MDKKSLLEKYAIFEKDIVYSKENMSVKKGLDGKEYVVNFKSCIGDLQVENLMRMIFDEKNNVEKLCLILSDDISLVVETFVPYLFLVCSDDRIKSLKLVLPYKDLGFRIIQEIYFILVQDEAAFDDVEIYTYKQDVENFTKWGKNLYGKIMNINVSRSLVPMIYVNDERFRKYFVLSCYEYMSEINFDRLRELVEQELNKSEKEKQKQVFNVIKKFLFDEFRVTERFDWLYYLYYYKIADYLGVLGLYYDPEIAVGLGRHRNKYVEGISKVLRRVLKMPVYYSILFYVCMMNKRLMYKKNRKHYARGVKKEEEIVSLLVDLESVVNQVDVLFYGIYEIAKNMKVHSTNKRGVICGRVYEKVVLKDIKAKSLNIVSCIDDMQFCESGAMKYLVMSMIDDGSIGIIDRLQKDLSIVSQRDMKEIVEKDLAVLKNSLIEKHEGLALHDLLYDKNKIVFERQKIKAAASYGLLMFVSNLEELSGMFRVDTVSVDGKRRIGFEKSLKKLSEYEDNLGYRGSVYNVFFPLKYRGNDAVSGSSDVFGEVGLTAESDDAFSELANIVVYSYEEVINKDVDPKMKGAVVVNVGYEEVHDLKEMEKKYLLAIDMKGYQMDGSELLRFLAELQLSKKNKRKDLIVYNVEERVVVLLIRILQMLFGGEKNFWSDDSAVLFYYFSDTLCKCFLLSGESYDEFYMINDYLRNKHIIGIPGEKEGEARRIENMGLTPNKKVSMLDKGDVLCYDLLLEVDEGETIFEYNSTRILNRRIKN